MRITIVGTVIVIVSVVILVRVLRAMPRNEARPIGPVGEHSGHA